jgi:hypothetical protein
MAHPTLFERPLRVPKWLSGVVALVLVAPNLGVPTPARADSAPAVTAPASITMNEGGIIMFRVSASDSDGDPIISLTTSPLPPGASFITGSPFLSGMFTWPIGFNQAGEYDVTFTATSGSPVMTGSATTHIVVTDVDRAPVVTAPATQSVAENNLLSFTVSVNDPDGDSINSLTAAPLPTGATFIANPSNTGGTFSWTPSVGQAGTYSVTFTASNALIGSGGSNVDVQPLPAPGNNHAPVFTPIPEVRILAGDSVNQRFTVTDEDQDDLTVYTQQDSVSINPVVNLPGYFEGEIRTTPDASFYDTSFYIEVCASDFLYKTCVDVLVTVRSVNQSPVSVLDAAPTTVCLGDPVNLDGRASYDPDNDLFTGTFEFGDGSPAVNGLLTDHYYSNVGQYTPTLEVRDSYGATSGPVPGPTIDVASNWLYATWDSLLVPEFPRTFVSPVEISAANPAPDPLSFYHQITPPAGGFDPATVGVDASRIDLQYTNSSGDHLLYIPKESVQAGYDPNRGVVLFLIALPGGVFGVPKTAVGEQALQTFYESFSDHKTDVTLTINGRLTGTEHCTRFSYSEDMTVVRNKPPVLKPIADVTMFRQPGGKVFNVSAIDPDQDWPVATTVDTSALLGGATDFDGHNGSGFSWWPCYFTKVGFNYYHTDACLGTFEVIARAQDRYGYWSAPVTVRITTLNNPPDARAPLTDPGQAECVGIPVWMQDSSIDPDSVPARAVALREWDFGDGTPTKQGVGYRATEALHAYQNIGIYPLTVTVTDDNGANDAFTLPLTVNPTTNYPGTPFNGDRREYAIGGSTVPLFEFQTTGTIKLTGLVDYWGYASLSAAGFTDTVPSISASALSFTKDHGSARFSSVALNALFSSFPVGEERDVVVTLSVPIRSSKDCATVLTSFTLTVRR